MGGMVLPEFGITVVWRIFAGVPLAVVMDPTGVADPEAPDPEAIVNGPGVADMVDPGCMDAEFDPLGMDDEVEEAPEPPLPEFDD